jgi:hypothetical protein
VSDQYPRGLSFTGMVRPYSYRSRIHALDRRNATESRYALAEPPGIEQVSFAEYKRLAQSRVADCVVAAELDATHAINGATLDAGGDGNCRIREG